MPDTATSAPTVTVQSIVYKMEPAAVARTLEALDNSARIGLAEGSCSSLGVCLGDSSPEPALDQAWLEEVTAGLPHLSTVDYTFFDTNTGTAKGHNMLAQRHDSDYLVTSNPDIVPDARALWRLLALFDDGTTGMAEAKQLPIEHPKDYDPHTGETGWAATAFAMTPRGLFEQLGGFDEQTFFMYCDDVDYSWLVREAGYSVRFDPAAVVFHDKRLSASAQWQPTDAEHFYSAQAALLLAHKWSRDDVVEEIARSFAAPDAPSWCHDALKEFEERRETGRLVAQHDPDHLVGEFLDGFYARHRYAL